MTTRLTKMAATTALVLTAGFGLAACSDDDTDAAPEASSASGDATTDAEPASDALGQDELAQRVPTAIVDAGTVHVVLGAGAVTGEGDVVVGPDGTSSAVAMMIGDVEVRLVDGRYYANLGQTSGGRFVSVDPAADGPFAAFSGLLGQANPASLVGTLSEVTTGFAASDETEEIDGVQTRAYVLTVDPAQVLTADQAQLAGGDLPESIDVTLYVGDDDLPRRAVTTVSGETITFDFSQWGDEVDVQAPPADQVIEGDAFGL